MYKAMKKVCVILVNYNGWKDTLECVEGLIRHCYAVADIVVVDNASTDESYEKLRQNTEFVLLQSDLNNGFSAGNNIGIKYAVNHKYEYVLLLNNDTLIDEDFITPMVRFCESNDQCGIISSRIFYASERNRIWYDGGTFNRHIARAIHYRFNETQSPEVGINEAEFVSGCCMLIPSKIIKKVGGLDERFFLYVEDTEFCLRVMKHGYRLYWDADHSIYHKVSRSTKKVSNLSQYYEVRNRLLVAKEYLGTLDKFTMHLYNIIFYTYKVIRQVYKIKILRKAITDYRHGHYGKTNVLL